MTAFETILWMLALSVGLMIVGRRLKLPYPVLLAVAGGVVAALPLSIDVQIEPELILALFVAPILLDAAFDTSIRDLRRNALPILSLAVVAVGLTTAAVAAVVHLLVPDLPWAAAVAIGAIVAPPDAVAATTVLRDLRLPHRIAVVLEGEALLNDASTLIVYKLAVAAAMAGGGIGVDAVAPTFLLSLGGSLVAGPLAAWLWSRVANRLVDAPSSIILQFVGTFGVWVVAERLSLSPVLTVVAYGMTLARLPSAYLPARLRVPSFAVWETAVLVLNILAFLLIGLELAPVLSAARPGELGRWFLVGGCALVTVVAVRLVWSAFAAILHRAGISRGRAAEVDGGAPSWRTGLVVGWAGTRGIVTVATALALPSGFPHRDMLLFVAFAVTLGTLVVQGLTLRPLVVALDVSDDDDPVAREERQARLAMADAALQMLDSRGDVADGALKRELREERFRASGGEPDRERASVSLRVDALNVRRARLLALRRDYVIGDTAFHRLEEELDAAEIALPVR